MLRRAGGCHLSSKEGKASENDEPAFPNPNPKAKQARVFESRRVHRGDSHLGGIRHGSGDFYATVPIFLVGFFREASGDPGWVILGRGTGRWGRGEFLSLDLLVFLPEAQAMKPTKKRKFKKEAQPPPSDPPVDERYAVRARTFRLRLDKDQRRALCNWIHAAAGPSTLVCGNRGVSQHICDVLYSSTRQTRPGRFRTMGAARFTYNHALAAIKRREIGFQLWRPEGTSLG